MLDNNIFRLFVACSRHSDGGERAKNLLGTCEKLTRELPSFFPLVFLLALTTYDLTCSPLSERLEQARLLKNASSTLVMEKGF